MIRCGRKNPHRIKERDLSVLFLIKEKSCWNEFFEYKKEGGHLSTSEEKELALFIENGEYLDISKEVLNAQRFPLPVLTELNKKHSEKKRKVFVFERGANYALKFISYLLNKYDFLFSDNLYSFRKNISVKKAISDLVANPDIPNYYSYKVDIHDYFNSVNITQITELLKKHLYDDDVLRDFLISILCEPNCIHNGKIVDCKKGILAGAPISGFLANLYLKELDEWFYERNIIYARYSDDIIVFAKTSDLIAEHEQKIKEFLISKGLQINNKKEHRTNPHEPWEFLGFRVEDNEIDISTVSVQKIKDKMRRKAKALVRWKKRTGACNERAIIAFIRHFNRKFYDNPKQHEVTWCRWYFPTITTSKSLHILDEYMVSCIRYIATGKHTKANYNLRYEEIKELGYRSLVNAYYYYKKTNLL